MTKKTRTLLFSLFLLLEIGLFFLPLVSQSMDITFENPLGPTTTTQGLINNILDFALKLVVPITAIMIVWAGFLFVTSAGNKAKVEAAQKTLIWAIVGLAVVILAQSVPAVIEEFLKGRGSSSTTQTQNKQNMEQNYTPSSVSEYNQIAPPPPSENINRAFVYDGSSAACQDNPLDFSSCCSIQQGVSEDSWQCEQAQ